MISETGNVLVFRARAQCTLINTRHTGHLELLLKKSGVISIVLVEVASNFKMNIHVEERANWVSFMRHQQIGWM